MYCVLHFYIQCKHPVYVLAFTEMQCNALHSFHCNSCALNCRHPNSLPILMHTTAASTALFSQQSCDLRHFVRINWLYIGEIDSTPCYIIIHERPPGSPPCGTLWKNLKGPPPSHYYWGIPRSTNLVLPRYQDDPLHSEKFSPSN